MARLTAALREQTEESGKLDQIIWANLEALGYGEQGTARSKRPKGQQRPKADVPEVPCVSFREAPAA
jgi:hypothetical protein